MVALLTFETERFDPRGEPPNPINPIAGESVLRWLCGKLDEKGCASTAPEPEDWGWYADVELDGEPYLLGACCHEADSGPHEWMLQIHPIRSFVDRILGRKNLDRTAPIVVLISSILESQDDFGRLRIEDGG